MLMKFPNGFLWGTSTAAHQIEGKNINSDWWEWEQSKDYKSGRNKKTGEVMETPTEPSGIACDSYHRYEEDFDLAKSMHNNAIRFSVEWARLEPKEGEFSKKEFDHYKAMIKAANDRGFKVFLTLHHFTNPQWFFNKGGWKTPNNVKYFERYVKKCAEEFKDTVAVYLTINEPQVYALQSYYVGKWMPCEKNIFTAIKVMWNMIKAHKLAYKAIKSVDINYQVGIAKNVVWHETKSRFYAFWDHMAADIMNTLNTTAFLVPINKYLDVIGVNYYFTGRYKNFKSDNTNDWQSDMHWWIYPEGLYNVLVNLKPYNKPIYITENGLADQNDKHRERFLKEMVKVCHKAIKDGVDLRGYFYWSLIDNFEWSDGYWPRFGLIGIDREHDLKRVPRKSAKLYAQIAKENGL